MRTAARAARRAGSVRDRGLSRGGPLVAGRLRVQARVRLPAGTRRRVACTRKAQGLALGSMMTDKTPDQGTPLGMFTLTPAHDDYPGWLRAIPDRPPVVYVRGRLPPDLRCVACVGTRSPSAFGKAAAGGIVSYLAARGWSIVSGLALGVDTICHEAALRAGGHTVAVLAIGLNAVYPGQNAELAERILTSGGALLSEQPLGTPALPRHLVSRDRLQSGMSAATVVMQTDVVGGTMHTVRYALLQGRLLIAPVPKGTHADEPKSRGLVALTQKTGTDFARLLDARGAYADLLSRKFADRPVAIPLANREDYATLLAALESAIDGADLPAPSRSAPPPGLQLELFDTDRGR